MSLRSWQMMCNRQQALLVNVLSDQDVHREAILHCYKGSIGGMLSGRPVVDTFLREVNMFTSVINERKLSLVMIKFSQTIHMFIRSNFVLVLFVF